MGKCEGLRVLELPFAEMNKKYSFEIHKSRKSMG